MKFVKKEILAPARSIIGGYYMEGRKKEPLKEWTML
jgi:hypothetical protein